MKGYRRGRRKWLLKKCISFASGLFLPLNSRDLLFSHVNFSCSWWLHNHDIWNSIDEVHVLVDSEVENQRHFLQCNGNGRVSPSAEGIGLRVCSWAAIWWLPASTSKCSAFSQLLSVDRKKSVVSYILLLHKANWHFFYRQASSHITLFIFINCFIQKLSRI